MTHEEWEKSLTETFRKALNEAMDYAMDNYLFEVDDINAVLKPAVADRKLCSPAYVSYIGLSEDH